MNVISLDPGIRGCGLAFFESGVLIKASYVRNETRKGQGFEAIHTMVTGLYAEALKIWPVGFRGYLAFEVPQVYRESRWKGDPNDLLPLMGIDAGFGIALSLGPGLAEVRGYRPREWKGTINPEECTLRVRSRLSAEEFRVVELPANTCPPCQLHRAGIYCTRSSCLAHNVYDAIGIGLKFLGRFEKGRVITR